MAISTNCNQAEGIMGNHEPTSLEKHVMFFDINNDGIIYPHEMYQGKFPSLLFPIVVENIKYAMHGSDTGAYDSEGRFVPEKFEEIFKKHTHQNADSLTYNEVNELLKTNREPKDYWGWANAFVDWKSLYDLGNKDGILTKETVKAVYDGSLFKQKAKEHAST